MPRGESDASLPGGDALKERPLKNIAASVHGRLLNEARESRRSFNELLQYYAMERFLYRLSKTRQARKFVLKGALMFTAWGSPGSRPTVDVDLLGKLSNDVETMKGVVEEACRQEVEPDGMLFDAAGVVAAVIAEEAEYEGVRVRFKGNLGNARASVQIDVGFGDVVTPPAKMMDYPTILDFPAPRLYGYSKESVIAEKFQAMVKRGILNSRMKDFYDIWFLSRRFDFAGRILLTAMRKTFENRETAIPAQPAVFEEKFATDPTKEIQWKSFVMKTRLEDAPPTFKDVAGSIALFLGPVASALAQRESFYKKWKAAGRWRR